MNPLSVIAAIGYLLACGVSVYDRAGQNKTFTLGLTGLRSVKLLRH
jgi:hypothetical protein